MSRAPHPLTNQVVLKDVEEIVASTPVDWDVFQDKCVLITGASGFLPAYLVETLLYLNHTRDLNIRITALVRNFDHFKQRFSHHADNPNLVALLWRHWYLKLLPGSPYHHG